MWINTNSPPNISPVITVQPLDATTLTNVTATFTLTATGTPAPWYQWQFATNSTPVTNFTAGASWTTNRGTALTNYFWCVATNAAGSVTSSVVFWHNTNGISAGTSPSFTTNPVNITMMTNNTATFTVGASGTAPLYYQFQYTNGTVVTNFNLTPSYTTNVLVALTNYYQWIVTNGFGAKTSSTVRLMVTNGINSLPVITVQPTNVTTFTNVTAVFSLTASGFPAPFFQWQYTNGTAVTNFTAGPTWTTNSSTPLTNYFRAVATNIVGNATSAVVYWHNNIQPIPPVFLGGYIFGQYRTNL
jgi:hypothetical protein